MREVIKETIQGLDAIDVVVDGDIICYYRMVQGEFKGLWRVKSFMGNLYYDNNNMAAMLESMGIDDIL